MKEVIKMMNINDIMKKAQSLTENGLPFMEGKSQLEVEGNILNNNLTVDNYGYMKGEHGEYVVVALREYPEHFIFGSSVVTQAFKNVDESLTPEEIEFLLEKGLTFKLEKVKSRNKKVYVKITFFPKDEEVK